MESRLQRSLQNRWLATIVALAIGYIAVRTLLYVAQDVYYIYCVYPKEKGDEYNYPELRYTLGQIAIFLWSAVELCTAALIAQTAFFHRKHKWAAVRFSLLRSASFFWFLDSSAEWR